MNPRASVVIAIRNRGGSVVRLVRHLGEQNLPPQAFEIIGVDDGSPEPVAPLLEDVPVAPRLRTCRIPWSGQGVVVDEKVRGILPLLNLHEGKAP